MDTFLAIASKRDWRRYAERTVPGDVVDRILEAGRVAGSARNRQPWQFLVVESADTRERLAETVYVPDHVRTAGLVVALVGPPSFDLGRAAQNMMLAAWNDGVASVPNGMPDADATARVLGLGADEKLAAILTFGYPARPRDVESRSAEDWAADANRKSLDEVVRRL